MFNRLRRDEEGSASSMTMIALIVTLTMITAVFMQLFVAYRHAQRARMLSDVVADGAASGGNNGWGIQKSEATKVKNDLLRLNRELFEEDKISVKTTTGYVSDDGKISKASGSNAANVVTATTSIKYDLPGVASESTKSKMKASSSTKAIFYGGIAIVKYAYSFTKQANPGGGYTVYMWGAGRGGGEDWQKYSDCSSFVAGVFRHFGYELPAYTGSMESMGELVGYDADGLSKAEPGDILLYFTKPGDSTHVGIFAGKSSSGAYYQVHNSGVGRDCVFGPLSSGTIMVRRVIKLTGKAYECPDKYGGLNLTDYEKEVVSLLKQETIITDAGIAAILGNFEQESGCDPASTQGDYMGKNLDFKSKACNGTMTLSEFRKDSPDSNKAGYPGFGIAQWTSPDRKQGLYNWIEQYSGSKKLDNLSMQVSYLIYELQHLYPSVYIILTSSNDVTETTTKFYREFEGPIGDTTLGTRISNANRVYGEIKSVKNEQSE